MPELVVVSESDASGDRDGTGDAGPRILARLGASDRRRLDTATAAQRTRFLTGRRAALAAVSRLTVMPADAFTIDAVCPRCGGTHGRPAISGPGRPVHVSIAHAGGRAFAAAARSPVGIDAEPLDAPAERLDVARAITGGGRGDPLARWTRVEAVRKADGRALPVDPAEVHLALHRARIDSTDTRYRVHSLRRDGCVVATALALP
ncbi:hypothetical protein ARHIZOSPH14_08650 [Agromyces rhizosphaerae]|uniref:4'-phosphopantetheinyl transferase superfamily protein n=1 Tax=Agromyces rhizosphaerae TaxID=88374 RepID=A0A9W6CQF3_9MICO|nr:hypothetical protein [Agromyces rhizosphaerae]GLI26623.1 hypothetical protein ARHIZOSPH14_08650 [Agromyces rhizosphaerae]